MAFLTEPQWLDRGDAHSGSALATFGFMAVIHVIRAQPAVTTRMTELRAEVEALRAIVEKLVQTVSALTPNSQDEARAPEEAPPGGTEEVLVSETYGVSAAEEEQLEGVA